MDSINTEGIVVTGEFETRALREAKVAEDYRNARVAGAVWALNATAEFARALLQVSGPYDDTRNLNTIVAWVADRIRDVQSPATEEPS